MKQLNIYVDTQGAGRRLDSVLAALLPQYSRTALKKAILTGRCCLDGLPATKPDVKVRMGQHLEITVAEHRSTLTAEEGDLNILWQDAHLVLCNKPAGLTVHPCPSYPEQTLVQRLLGRFPQLSKLEGQRPGIVHRLDKDTSGLLLVALTESMRLRLSEAFARREVQKHYLALVSGLAPEKGECREPLGRHPTIKIKMCVLDRSRGGKTAHTEWQRLWHNPAADVSLLNVRIHTGRTHQIRVHMAHVGHPLLGDKLYAPAPVRDMAPRQMLHAWQLDFVHPHTGEALHFICPPPDDMPAAALAACHTMQRVVLTGNPGCGKSSLAAQLRELGLPVLNADAVVRELYAPGGEAAQWIAQRWGEQLLTARGQVDKTALLQAMQSNSSLRKELEAVVHSLVRAAIERFWQQQEAAGEGMAVAEIPLYFECAWDELFTPQPITVGVHCPQHIRHERIMRERGWDAAKTAALEGWQWPEARKEAACDILVDNSGPRELLAARARQILEDLSVRASRHQLQAAEAIRACWFS